MNKKILFTACALLAAGSFLHAQHTQDELLEELFGTYEMHEIEQPAEVQKELKIIQGKMSLTLNPHLSVYSQEAQILNSLYEGLFTYNPITSEPDFGLITDYKTSRDQLYWTFTISSEARYSDGTRITAEDVKNSWLELMATPGAYFSSFLDVIKGAKEFRLGKGSKDDVAIFVKDKNTLGIQLTSPTSHLPKLLCHCAFSVFNTEKSVFSGPYLISEYSDEKIVLEKNEYYHASSSVRIPKITIFFSDDSEENSYRFNTGEVQLIDSTCAIRSILDKNAIRFDPIFGTYYFFFKTGNENLTEKVRTALLEAVPWEELRTGSMFPASTLIYPIAGYRQPQPLSYTDYEHAQVMMNDAKKELGLSENDMIELTFAIPEGESIYQAALLLKYSWARVGVKLNISVEKNPAYLNNISKINADLFLSTWIGDFSDPLAFLELFRGDSSLNDTGWKNDKYDKLLLKAAKTIDSEKRMDILSEAEDLLLSSGMVIPVTHSIDMNVVNSNELAGWSPNPLNIHPYKNIYFKKASSSFKHGKVAMLPSFGLRN